MVLARVANFFTNGGSTNDLVVDDNGRYAAGAMQRVESSVVEAVERAASEEIDDEAARPPYLHVRVPSLDDAGVS
jgi:hypothetical protein